MKRIKESKNQKLKTFFLVLILALAVVLRLWKLDQYPAGFNADEAAIGYNAYSLLKTGKDEYGTPWPLVFKSFADYKPGLYFYLVLPLIKILGLSEFAVRLPSAILGTLTVLFVMFLIQELFLQMEVSLIAGLLLAISPWHLHFSRGGWETNVATFLLTTGAYFFLKALKDPKLFTFSFLLFTFSLYTYHSARIIAPILLFFLCLIKRIKLRLNWLIVSIILASILSLPLISMMFSEMGTARFSGLSIFADQGPFWETNEARGEHPDPYGITAVFFHNKLVAYGRRWLSGYLAHFDPEFLFVTGDPIERNKIPEMGLVYFFEILTIAVGSYSLLKIKTKAKWLIFTWLTIAPLASSLTFQTPHALRAHNMVIPLTVISAFGAYKIILWTREKLPSVFLFFCFSVFLLNFYYYLHQYYLEYPRRYPLAWGYGFRELVQFVKPIQDRYDKIIVTDRYDQPYILFLFYLKYPPENYQLQAKLSMRDKFGFGTVRSFDSYHFRKINWEEDKNLKNTLIIGTDEEIPDSAEVMKTIYFPNGKPAFEIVAL